VVRDHLPFARTAKGGVGSRTRQFPAFWEAALGVLLLLGAAVLVATNAQQIREINVFAAVLVIQSLPFLAAATLARLETSRANTFAFWASAASAAARLAELLPRRAGVARQGSVINDQRVTTGE
jgi:hypothetical protein